MAFEVVVQVTYIISDADSIDEAERMALQNAQGCDVDRAEVITSEEM